MIPPVLDPNLWKTFQEWSSEGYRIRRGTKSLIRRNGVPLFFRGQVEGPLYYYSGESDFDREEDADLADFFGINPWGG